MNTAAPKRCAVYCRVSTDERLHQSFNSIDAQKEAGLASVASQRAEGWIPVPDDYIDPGFSGGNLERPGLKRLLADIEAGKIDIVVVYKIDRLTRSLTDFSRLIEVFERNKVSFVAVTQQFNTTTSMGRLMLNVLLSFAQFEREVTGERIRDKIAASKAKGMWMGGPLPLGYDVENRLLVINEVEAKLVRRIFTDFTRCRSTTDMVRELTADGQTTKSGLPFTKQMLYKMMHNRIYRGEILHKGKYYPGQHQALIEQDLWDAVHAILAENNRQRASATLQRRQPEALLLGLFYAQDGERFQPAFTRKANGKMYRYYVPIRKVRFGAKATGAGRLPAEPIEQLVLAQVHAALKTPEVVQSVCDRVAATTPDVTEPEVVLALRQLGNVWEQLFPVERQRIVQLLIERVTLLDNGIEIGWRESGWSQLVGELLPDTIGAELREIVESEEAMA
ncbi:MAG: DNA-invertase hin [Candidatus Accumulibacter sp. BA-94]|uniref:recombinase family protein n=1 Tax=Accumulibacter sp. TaxID=2053492 RepID=UPI000452BAFB|nr:recombinase family protein [Accumulibacter sp.]EXI92780.1 MAG: DNA-invertase hin [Candidatus Accumulibacter sp. BA-94]HRD86642.1 recombinase family protein [Accumulibacter sp.]